MQKEDKLSSAKRGLKEKNIRRMSQDLDRIQRKRWGASEEQLPLRWCYSSQLPGVILDCNRSFRQHFLEMRQKLARRQQILMKVSNAAWGLECRGFAVTTGALLKSVL